MNVPDFKIREIFPLTGEVTREVSSNEISLMDKLMFLITLELKEDVVTGEEYVETYSRTLPDEYKDTSGQNRMFVIETNESKGPHEMPDITGYSFYVPWNELENHINEDVPKSLRHIARKKIKKMPYLFMEEQSVRRLCKQNGRPYLFDIV